jgi:hypothetical protein
MLLGEVEQLLGRPADRWVVSAPGMVGDIRRYWGTENATIAVEFDTQEKVVVARWASGQEWWWERIRQWVGL